MVFPKLCELKRSLTLIPRPVLLLLLVFVFRRSLLSISSASVACSSASLDEFDGILGDVDVEQVLCRGSRPPADGPDSIAGEGSSERGEVYDVDTWY